LAWSKIARRAESEPVDGLWGLPDAWRWERLNEVAPVNPPRNFDKISEDANLTFLPMAAVTELTGALSLDEQRALASVRSGFTRFRSGDVIFAKITPCMENGKIAIIPELPHGMGAGSTEFHVLEPQQVDARYLYYWLSQRTFRQNAEHNMTGTAGQKRVPTEWLRSAPIPVPPTIDETRRVADRIDALFAEIGEGDATLADVQIGIETYRRSLLKAAVTGELTADWRHDNAPQESGTEMLQRILTERREQWEADPKNARKAYVGPVGPDRDGLPELPEEWEWASLDQLCAHITSGSRAWSKYYDRGTSTFIMAQNVRAGRYDHRHRQLVGPPQNDPERRRTQVFRNDLLLTIVGANTGDLCQVGFDPEDHYVCQSVALLRPTVHEIGAMVELVFSTPFGRDLQMNKLIYGAGRPHLSFEQIRGLAVPLPPIDEIGAILNAASQAIRSIPSQEDIKIAQANSSMLRQSILAAAFRGELTA